MGTLAVTVLKKNCPQTNWPAQSRHKHLLLFIPETCVFYSTTCKCVAINFSVWGVMYRFFSFFHRGSFFSILFFDLRIVFFPRCPLTELSRRVNNPRPWGHFYWQLIDPRHLLSIFDLCGPNAPIPQSRYNIRPTKDIGLHKMFMLCKIY